NGTFRGNIHAFVTARVAIEKFWSDDRFQARLAEKSALIGDRLADLAAIIPGGKIKGRGMMLGVDVGTGALAADICARAFDKGLMIETSGNEGQIVKVLAPLTTSEATLNKGLDILLSAANAALDAPERIAAE
ncbi:aminotransferase class III-fold pyridoxal phosphate-dependent enzyme, partial [Hoeflea sp.]|uniref:aminotransferase class III-fold pyridoxal phosphate-dependent enzyme n=1 Tax=Hoeflea sp. TaxID=1940281 RepID=UPI0019BAECF7